MTKTITFKTADLKRLINHAQSSKSFIQNTNRPQLFLTYSENGIYLTSNGLPIDQAESGEEYRIYAKGFNPNKDENWKESATSLFLDGYFDETLPIVANIPELLEDKKVNAILLFKESETKFLFTIDFEAFCQSNETSIRGFSEEITTRNANGEVTLIEDVSTEKWEDLYQKTKPKGGDTP